MWKQQLPILYYLMPAVSLALLIRWNCRSFRFFAAFMFLGVLLHETLHLIIGAILNAKPVGMSVIPKRGREGTMELGSVCFSNITWYNALPLALAPLFGCKRSISRTSVLSIASHESSRIATTPYNDWRCPGISGQ